MNFHLSEAANLAIHALTYLAQHKPPRPLSTAEVARYFGASEAHLSKVLQRLTKAGLVKSVRGPRGGFVLAAEPSSITLRKIYETIDGRLTTRGHCLLGKRACPLKVCIFGGLAEDIHAQIKDHFSGTTLADLIG